MSFFDWFKPNPSKLENKKDSILIVESQSIPGTIVWHSANYVPGFDHNLPSTECSECHKIRNVYTPYYGPLYACPDCVSKNNQMQNKLYENEQKIKELEDKLSNAASHYYPGILSGNISSGSVGRCTLTSGSVCSGFLTLSKYNNFRYCCS